MRGKRLLASLLLGLGALTAVRAQTLTLERTINIAQDSAISARLSRSLFQTSKWEYEQSLAQRRPQISFNVSPVYQKISFEYAEKFYKVRNYDMFNGMGEIRLEQQALNIGGEFYAKSGVLYTWFFNATTPSQLFSTIPIGIGYSNDLLFFNAHKWEKELCEIRLKAGEQEFDHALRTIALESATLFIACYVAEEQYNICATNARVASQLLTIGREKFDMASIGRNELSALELQSLNAENVLYAARVALENAKSDLLSYLRLKGDGQNLTLGEPADPMYRNVNIDEALSFAHKNNPDIIRAREAVIAARQNAKKAAVEGSFIRAGVDVNVGIQSTNTDIPNMYLGQQPYSVGSVTIKIPLFDGGLAKSKKKIAQYQLNTAMDSEMEAVRALDLEVANTLREFNVQQDLLLRCREAVKLADESFALIQDLYSSGETDINTFILAQSRKDEAHTNYLASLSAYWNSYYTLRMLCGIDF